MSSGSGDDRLDVTQLVQEIQAGRSPEYHFQRIFERYCAPVTHFFANRGFSAQEAEDLAQDAFIRVYRNIGAFRLEASFETWLFRIAGNVWKNALRSRSALKRVADTVPLDEIVKPGEDRRSDREHEPEEVSEDPLDQVLAAERMRLLRQAIEELPPKMRECVLLRVTRGLKYREIADMMKTSISSVKSQLHAAKQRLKPLLEHFDVFEF